MLELRNAFRIYTNEIKIQLGFESEYFDIIDISIYGARLSSNANIQSQRGNCRILTSKNNFNLEYELYGERDGDPIILFPFQRNSKDILDALNLELKSLAL